MFNFIYIYLTDVCSEPIDAVVIQQRCVYSHACTATLPTKVCR